MLRPSLLHKNFKRLAKISFQNIGRNLLLSVATSVMMGLILFIFNVILALNILTEGAIEKVGEKVDLILYVSDSAGAFEITELTNEIKKIEGVKAVDFISKDKALGEFLALYPEKADPFNNYDIENPLPANIKIVTDEPAQHETVIEFIKNSKFSELLIDIESSDENQEIIGKLVSVTDFTQKLIFGVIITFIFGSLLITINAIHLSIFTRKLEIQVMQLVGANPNMIRLPFIFEGVVYSLIAVLFSFTLLIVFLEGSELSSLETFKENFNPALLFFLEFIGSVFIGVLSSYIALNYYLKRNFMLEH